MHEKIAQQGTQTVRNLPQLNSTNLDAGEDFSTGDSDRRKPTAIILEPSKDLAEQTYDFMCHFKQYLRSPQLQCELLIGGTNPKQATRALQEGVDIVTGTPGVCSHQFCVLIYLRSPQLQCELLILGINPKQATRALQEGVDIVTGTPGVS